MKRRTWIGALVVVVGLALDSHGAAVGGDADRLPDDVVLARDLRYREGPSRHWTLDLARPRRASARPRPAIVVIHGGGWIEGDKSSFATTDRRTPGNVIDFARLGFVAATINYRLAGESPYPAAVWDCRCALRWLRAHAGEYGVDPERIGAYGNSAGGHLALLLALSGDRPDPDPSAPWRGHSSALQAAASDSGPVDLVRQYEHAVLRTAVVKFLGGPPTGARLADYKAATPNAADARTIPPLLLIYGVADEQVPVESADRFVLALGGRGAADVSYLRLAAVGHCPHSIQRVDWLRPAVNAFFARTLQLDGGARKKSGEAPKGR